MRPIDLCGHRFGRLIVIERSTRPRHWHCRCDCGEVKEVDAGALKRGDTRSCGCLQRERAAARATKHGGVGTREYATWVWMVRRCHRLKPGDGSYSTYQGRGIIVCARWRASFLNFLADMGPAPSAEYTLDRIDNNGNYEPGNCRWATLIEQSNNKRTNRVLTLHGQTKTLAQWSRETGLPDSTLYNRVSKLGWDTERALMTPRGRYSRRS